jgi:hypothetical protein
VTDDKHQNRLINWSSMTAVSPRGR